MNPRDKTIAELLPRVRAEVQKTVRVGELASDLADDMHAQAVVALVEFVTENVGRINDPKFTTEAVEHAYRAANTFRMSEERRNEQLASDLTDEVVDEVEGDSPDPLGVAQRVELESALAKAGEGLTEKQIEVMRLRYGGGLTQEETAGQLKIDQAAVSRLEARAVKQMRDKLEALGFEKADFLPDAVTSNALKGKRSSGPFVASNRGDAYRAIREWLKDVVIHEAKFRTSSAPYGYASTNWDAISQAARRAKSQQGKDRD